MHEDKLSERESLSLIQQMIQVAKDDHRENGDGWLIWGWLLFIASVSSGVLSYLKLSQYIPSIWIGMLALGLVLGFVLHMRKRKREEVKTYVHELLDRLGTGFFISLFAMITVSMLSQSSSAFAYYYILFAFWMFIHGSAIRFRPLIIGAVVNWVAGVSMSLIQIYVDRPFKYIMIVSAFATLIGYLVPGYILRSEYRKKMIL